MNRRCMLRVSAPRVGPCALAIFALGLGACFTSLDPTQVKCAQDSHCPRSYVCAKTPANAPSGTCVAILVPGTGGAPGRVDAGSVDGGTGTGGAMTPLDASIDGGGGVVDVGRTGTGGSAGAGGAGGAGGVLHDAPNATGGRTAPVDAPIEAAAGLPNGETCSTGAQCASALCINAVCCATACSGCNACSNALTGKENGICAPAANGTDPNNACADETTTNQCGNDGTCDGTGTCRKVSTSHVCTVAFCSTDGKSFTPPSMCDGKGLCTTAQAEDCSPYQCTATGCARSCTRDGDCGASYYCNGDTCALKKADKGTCTASTQCVNNNCLSGYCCPASCATCTSCVAGACVASPSGTACGSGKECNTSGSCLTSNGGVCSSNSQCSSGNCAGGLCCQTGYRGCNGSCTAIPSTPLTAARNTTSPQSTCAGTARTFSVTASGGSGSFAYEWRKDGVALANSSTYTGVSTAILTVSNPTTAQSGSYTCVVRDTACSAPATSAALVFTVNPRPVVAAIEDRRVPYVAGLQYWSPEVSGGSGTYSSYQWYKNDSYATESADCIGTQTNQLGLRHMCGNVGTYYLEVTDSLGCRGTSNSATFTVYCPSTGADCSPASGC